MVVLADGACDGVALGLEVTVGELETVGFPDGFGEDVGEDDNDGDADG